jgi:hypothetical protein
VLAQLMDLGFHGEVADFYQRYRRGYPPPVIDALVEAFGLTSGDIAVDLGGRSVGAVTIGQALHWMDDGEVFRAAAGLVRPGGGVAVVTNGTPIWLQDTDWSRALRQWLEDWLGHGTGNPCGTDEASQQRYAAGLAAAGYRVTRASISYAEELTLDQVTGGLYSALQASQLPPLDQRPQFAAQIRGALAGHAPYTEHVEVSLVLGTVSAAAGG